MIDLLYVVLAGWSVGGFIVVWIVNSSQPSISKNEGIILIVVGGPLCWLYVTIIYMWRKLYSFDRLIRKFIFKR